jgi:hypothetical protein
MIVHPFWNMRNFTEANWLAEIYNAEIKDHTESNRNGTVSIVDTFNLHRRPGWCYEKLIEQMMNKIGRNKFQGKSIRISPSQFYSMKNCAYKSLLAEAFDKKPLLATFAECVFRNSFAQNA